jgi:hypothetical protein
VSGTTAAQQPNPRQQPGASVTIFAPEQHDLYDGRFVISVNRIYMVGGLNDAPGWDHLDNDAKNVQAVGGTAEIDVNEIQNTGTFEARLKIPEGDFVLVTDRWHQFSPCQNGGLSLQQTEYKAVFRGRLVQVPSLRARPPRERAAVGTRLRPTVVNISFDDYSQ